MGRYRVLGLTLVLVLAVLAVLAGACAPAAPSPTATQAPTKSAATTAPATAPTTAPGATPAAQATQPARDAAQPWEKELKFPTIYGTTGADAARSSSYKNGMGMALEEINAAGGIAGRTLTLQNFDPGSDATQAASLVRQVSDWALVVIGPGTTLTARGGVPVGNQLQIPILAVSSLPDLLAQNRPWSFGLLSDPATFAEKGVKAFVKRERSVKKVVLITDYSDPATGAQAKGLEAGIKDANLQLLDTIAFKTGDVDFSAQITKTKGDNPDAVLISAMPPDLASLIRDIRRGGITVPILSSQTGWDPPNLVKIAGDAMEGVYGAIEWSAADPNAQGFVQKYQTKFNEPASQTAIIYYDIIYRLKAAFESAKLTGDPSKLQDERTKLRDTLADPAGWTGAYGKWVWNKDGMPTKPGVLIQIKDGKEVVLQDLSQP